jgi:predicted ATPase
MWMISFCVARGERGLERLHPDTPLPDLSLIFTPSSPVAQTNLPIAPTPFIGRQVELSAIGQLLCDPGCRMLTLVGPGGIGKTRLAIQTATTLVEEFTHGAAFVGLASLDSPAFLITTIAQALDFKFHDADDPQEQLFSYLRERHMLLVLDNVEHLLDGSLLFAEIVRHAPQVKLLLTSREPMHLQGEWVFEVRGLALPQGEGAEAFDASSAVSLFLQRARQSDIRFTLSAEERQHVVRICQLVEGMPLAIELAATWVNALSCREIAEEIERSLDFLSTSMRDLPERHRSMRAVFDHSWKMLSEEERHVLSCLSVFTGGFTRQAAEFVAGASLTVLGGLVLRSLVQRTTTGHYGLHELIRQYSIEILSAAGELDAVKNRHLEYFLKLAQTAEQNLLGEQQGEWLSRLDAEHDNLRAALNWAVACRKIVTAQQLSSALVQFWLIRGYLSEGRYWVQAALEHAEGTPAVIRAATLLTAGRLAMEQRDLDSAETFFKESLALKRALSDLGGEAAVLNSLGSVAWYRGDLQGANALYEEVLTLRRELNEPLGIANALNNLGLVAMGLQEYERAEQILDESASLTHGLGNKQSLANTRFNLGLVTVRMEGGALRAAEHFTASVALSRELGYRKITAYALNNLAMLALHRGDAPLAATLAQESFSLCTEMEEELGAFFALINLGDAALLQDDPAQASQHFNEALELIQKMSQHGAPPRQVKEGMAWLLQGVARLALAQAQPVRALRLAGASTALLEAVGETLPPTAQAYSTEAMEAARSRLGEAASESAWEDGIGLHLAGDDPYEAVIEQILNAG